MKEDIFIRNNWNCDDIFSGCYASDWFESRWIHFVMTIQIAHRKISVIGVKIGWISGPKKFCAPTGNQTPVSCIQGKHDTAGPQITQLSHLPSMEKVMFS